MKASSYPVLNNRPIDQWKVTELKEELKRRKLATKGLKDELIRRLDEDLRNEMESSNQEESDNGNKVDDNADETTLIASESVTDAAEVVGVDVSVKHADGAADGKNIEVDPVLDQAVESVKNFENGNDKESKLKGEDHAVETTPITIETIEPVSEVVEVDEGVDILVKDPETQAVGKSMEVDDVSGQAVKDDNVEISDQILGQQAEELTDASLAVREESVTDEQSMEICNAASENTSLEAALAGQGSENKQTGNENSDSRTQLDEEVKHVMSDLNSQVSAVSPSLGIPMTNVSVSTDSISINEKNELKDNIIADDVKLEPDVKLEMVKPSSSPLVPDGGESRPMDVEEPQIEVSADETKKTVDDEDMSKKNYSADLGSPEKLNLDRSSGDDSMEEDTLENKQVDSAYNPVEVGGSVEKTDVSILKEETTIDAVVDDLSAARKDGHVDELVAVDASTEKRKLPDNQEALANNEPSKRQRRWKTESVKATESVKPSEPLSSSPAMSTTPRGTPQALGSKRSFSRSNSNADDDAPKDRVVPPPVKPPTDSLRIDNFLRPFTLKAVQELLGKTGTVNSFWMDHIKTHCYVTYSSVEEATETRNAVYNLKWPSNGGRLLVAEFVDAEEVKSHAEAPQQPPTPTAPANAPPDAPVAQLQPSPRQLGPRQKQLLQTNLPPPPPLTNPPPVRERLQPPPPPPLEKVDPPVVTLDDLFRKTKTTPRIYYLPLSEEVVKAKLNSKQ